MDKEIKTQSTKKNFIFQMLYQIVALVMPLVTAPYLTRTLGDTALGEYSYTYSISSYFVVLAMLGISRHGQRIIASRRTYKEALSKTFWSLYFVHVISSFFAVAAYLTFIMIAGEEYRELYLIQLVYVCSALFDITWLFYGIENFQTVIIRNFFVRLAECFLVFTLIKSSNDLQKYTIIMACSACIRQAIMLPQAIRLIKPVKFSFEDVKEHFKPLLVLFVAVVASTLYTVFDKTLLGLLSSTENVAYYEYSNKIISVPKTIIGTICAVLFPRACACLAKGNIEDAKKYMDYSLHFTCFLGVGSLFGLLGIGNLFAVLYFGESFAVCGNIIMALAPVIIINEIGNIVRTQYMVPNRMDRLFTICLLMNAVLNIILSTMLIPILGIYGAVIGTLAAETFGTCFQLIVSRNFLPIKKVLVTMLPYMAFGMIMYVIIYLFKKHVGSSWIDLIVQIAVGGGVYCILCTVYLLVFSSVKENARAMVCSMMKRIIK